MCQYHIFELRPIGVNRWHACRRTQVALEFQNLSSSILHVSQCHCACRQTMYLYSRQCDYHKSKSLGCAALQVQTKPEKDTGVASSSSRLHRAPTPPENIEQHGKEKRSLHATSCTGAVQSSSLTALSLHSHSPRPPRLLRCHTGHAQPHTAR